MKQSKYYLKSKCGNYALYQLNEIKSRRYRSNYPTPYEKGLKLLIISSLSRAKDEQQRLFEYCSENYDIYDYKTNEKLNK